MSHFAEIDDDNMVVRVIVAEQEFINSGAVGDSDKWIQTSYNDKFRNRFAGVGDVYDKELDMFIPKQPFPSWTLNEKTYMWESPVAHPDANKSYLWDEDKKEWKVDPDPPAHYDDPPSTPDISWLKADIQAYMDTHNISYNASDTKAELLTKIEEA